MNTTYFGQTLIEQAVYWQEKWIKEACKKLPAKDSTSGRGGCVDDLKEMFSRTVEGTPWCAQFVSVCYKTAREKLQLKAIGKLPYTQSTATMLNGAKKNGLTVDSTPRVGSVFYRSRDGGGHVGIVVAISDDGTLLTIEGNSDNQVKGRTYDKGKYSGWSFIHVEDEESVSALAYALRDPLSIAKWGAVLGGVGVATYKVAKYVHHKRKATTVADGDGTMKMHPEVAAILQKHNITLPNNLHGTIAGLNTKTLADTLAGLK